MENKLDKFTVKLLELLNYQDLTARHVRADFEAECINDDERLVKISDVIAMINDVRRMADEEEKRTRPISKFLYIEDGSVDYEELVSELRDSNPEIKVILYRQGSCPPTMVDVLGKED